MDDDPYKVEQTRLNLQMKDGEFPAYRKDWGKMNADWKFFNGREDREKKRDGKNSYDI